MDRVAALPVLLAASVSQACMGAGPVGEPVRFSGQTNIVVWDKLRGIEHFVRDARFETRARNLGFIAPSPSRPGIVAVDRAAFSDLAALGSNPTSFGGGGGGGFGGGGRGVEVVEKKLVAGYEATVLKAGDSQALVDWLSGNGYEVPRFATRWAAPYVRRGWYFTAFKVATGEGSGATGPVRVTFKTDVPFNPYSVPAENQGRGGLDLYYVSSTSEEAKIGGKQPWIAPRWAVKITEKTTKKLEGDLKLLEGVLPKKSTVSFYRDASFGRPGFDDIYFVARPKASPKVDGSLGFLGLGALGLTRIGRRRG